MAEYKHQTSRASRLREIADRAHDVLGLTTGVRKRSPVTVTSTHTLAPLYTGDETTVEPTTPTAIAHTPTPQHATLQRNSSKPNTKHETENRAGLRAAYHTIINKP